MILIISNKRDATSDFVETQLQSNDVAYHRIDTDDLSDYDIEVESGRDCFHAKFGRRGVSPIDLKDITSIYYRRPGLPVLPKDLAPALVLWVQNEYRKLWGGVLSARQDLKWVNHPLAISAASYKPEQLARAPTYGLQVPATLITNNPDAASQFCERLDWRVAVKPIGHGQVGNDDSTEQALIYTNRINRGCSEKLAAVAECPTLFQEYVEKSLDIRVTIVDDECVAVALHSQDTPNTKVDCRRDNMEGIRYEITTLPDPVQSSLLALTHSYGLSFAAIDLAVDGNGCHWFLELNPAGQWAWLEEQGGAPISSALIRSLVGP